MAEYVTDQITYEDGGRTIRKSTWYDPSTGASWDTFDDAGPAGQPGTNMFDPSQSAYAQEHVNNYLTQQGGSAFQGAQYAGPAASSAQAPQLTTNTTSAAGKSKAPDNQPSSSTYAAPAAQTGGQQVPPQGSVFNPQGQVSADPQLQQTARNQFLYPETNPQQALANVLRGMGLYSSLGNPFSNILMRAAPGLGAAFAIGNVNAGRGPNDVSPDVSGDFASFMRNNISGQGGSNLFNTLQGARQGLGSAIDTISQTAGNTDPSAVNPYITSLRALLEQGGGMGLAQALGGLSAPFMNPAYAGAYGQGLQSAIGQGVYNYGQSPQFTGDQNAPENYWLKYLFGGGNP